MWAVPAQRASPVLSPGRMAYGVQFVMRPMLTRPPSHREGGDSCECLLCNGTINCRVRWILFVDRLGRRGSSTDTCLPPDLLTQSRSFIIGPTVASGCTSGAASGYSPRRGVMITTSTVQGSRTSLHVLSLRPEGEGEGLRESMLSNSNKFLRYTGRCRLLRDCVDRSAGVGTGASTTVPGANRVHWRP